MSKMAPELPIEVDSETGVWTSDALPMLYVPRHFFINNHVAVEEALGVEKYAEILYHAGYKSAWHWCEKEAELHGLVGVEVMPAWDLSAYRIIESAAAIDQNGDLQVNLDFVNEADFDQPYPILRVSLEDRWGDEIGSREVPPSEYMGPDLEGRMLGSDRRARGEAALADPVPEAVGFRLDLCLPDTEGKLRCLSNQP